MDVEACPDCGVKMINGFCPECGKPAVKSETTVPVQVQAVPGSRPPGFGSTPSQNSRTSSSGGMFNR